MTDENKNVEVKVEKCNCICHSEAFRKFVVIAAGTFVGVYAALSLFTAIHKPPMPMQPFGPMFSPCPCHCQMQPKFEKRHNFDGTNFQKKFSTIHNVPNIQNEK